MKKTVLTLLLALSLGAWSFAQTEQTQSSDTNKSSSASGIESGPTVDARDDSATIRWRTQDRAATIVKYGTDKNNLDKQARHSGGARDHNVTLAELKPGTKYFYQIQKNSGEVRAEGEFTTKGSGESAGGSGNQGGNKGGGGEDNVVITEGPTVQPGADGKAKIVWKTDDVAATDVKYGTDPSNLQQRAYKPGGSREHDAELKNLQAGQTYHYQILRRDGSVRTTGQFQYQPQAASTTPAAPGQTASGQQAGSVQITGGPFLDTVTDKGASITWITSAQSSSTVRYGTDRNNLSQTATGAWGGNHLVNLSNLQPNTTYYFQIESVQGAGQAPGKSEVGGFKTLTPGAQAQRHPPIMR